LCNLGILRAAECLMTPGLSPRMIKFSRHEPQLRGRFNSLEDSGRAEAVSMLNCTHSTWWWDRSPRPRSWIRSAKFREVYLPFSFPTIRQHLYDCRRIPFDHFLTDYFIAMNNPPPPPPLPPSPTPQRRVVFLLLCIFGIFLVLLPVAARYPGIHFRTANRLEA